MVGKTLRETRDLIARTYTDVIRQPYVSVALDETASKRRVYVGGMVDKPASYMLPLGSTPTEAIVAAGITDESDLRSVTVRHPGGEAVTVDMSGLRTQAPVDTTILLGWDDRVYVPAFENRLTVLGQVTKPGTFTIPLGRVIRVVDLLTQVAGGFTETADRRTAMLIRDSGKTTETLDLRKMLERGDMSQNYELRGGDVVVIPEADRVTVAGEVVAPASFYGGAHLTLLEALVKAGGFTARAGLKQARVKRADGQVSELDLESLWRRGDTSKNLELTPGDVLIIPRADPEEVLITGAVQKAGTVEPARREGPLTAEDTRLDGADALLRPQPRPDLPGGRGQGRQCPGGDGAGRHARETCSWSPATWSTSRISARWPCWAPSPGPAWWTTIPS